MELGFHLNFLQRFQLHVVNAQRECQLIKLLWNIIPIMNALQKYPL